MCEGRLQGVGKKKAMNCRRIVHIICADGTLARKYRRELECGGDAYEFRLSPSQVGALRDFSAGEINVILLDESATADALKLVVEELTMAAPVVAVAAAGRARTGVAAPDRCRDCGVCAAQRRFFAPCGASGQPENAIGAG